MLKGNVSLIENVSKGIVEAMKAKDADVLGTLRMLKTALTMREVEKGRGLEPGEELQVVASLVKQRRDSIEQFTKGNRPELAAKEAREITILERPTARRSARPSKSSSAESNFLAAATVYSIGKLIPILLLGSTGHRRPLFFLFLPCQRLGASPGRPV
jgi:uncharacterized protein YqeY